MRQGNTYSCHGAFHPVVIQGPNGTWYLGAKWHFFRAKWNRDTEILQQTHARVIYWQCFDEFTSALSVLRELEISNFNASMVVRMNNGLSKSQIVQSYQPWGPIGTRCAVLPQAGHKVVNIIFSIVPVFKAYNDIFLWLHIESTYWHCCMIPAKYHNLRLDILMWGHLLLSYAILPRLSLHHVNKEHSHERSPMTQGLYSLSGKTSYRQISWSIEAARLDVAMVVSLWNLTGTSAAALSLTA